MYTHRVATHVHYNDDKIFFFPQKTTTIKIIFIMAMFMLLSGSKMYYAAVWNKDLTKLFKLIHYNLGDICWGLWLEYTEEYSLKDKKSHWVTLTYVKPLSDKDKVEKSLPTCECHLLPNSSD